MFIRSLLLFLLAGFVAFAFAGQAESSPGEKKPLVQDSGSDSEGEATQGQKQKGAKSSFMTAPKLLALSLMTLLSLSSP